MTREELFRQALSALGPASRSDRRDAAEVIARETDDPAVRALALAADKDTADERTEVWRQLCRLLGGENWEWGFDAQDPTAQL